MQLNQMQLKGAKGDPMPLSVLSIIIDTFSEIGKHRGALLRTLLLPVSLLALMEVEPGRMADFSLVWALLQLPVLVLFMVPCHRIVLLGPKSLANPLGLSWSARETRFLFWLVLVILIAALFIAVALGLSEQGFWVEGTVGWLLQLAVIVPGLYLASRLSLALPQTAIDQKPELASVWPLSAGNGWRLTIALLVFPLLGLLLRNGLDSFWGLPSAGPGEFVVVMATYLLGSFEVVALTVAFRFLDDIEETT
jgi:hypothetical protein